MHYRPYTKNGPKVSEIGFGAWQLGNDVDWEGMTDEAAVELVRKAVELGVNFFDTAPNYGLGKSETLLGMAFKGIPREKLVINTKFGHHADGHLDYHQDAIRRSVEGSLERLKMNYIDSILLHNPPSECLLGDSPHYKVLEQLKKEGLIKAYGSSVDTAKDMMTVLDTTDSEVMEIFFNIFHQDTRAAFEKAKAKGVALIGKIPLDSGWLSGKYHAGSTFTGIRSRWSPKDIERRGALLEELAYVTQSGHSLAKVALSYVLGYDAIATIIPGTRDMAQLHTNVDASYLQLPPETILQLEKFYDEKIKPEPLPW